MLNELNVYVKSRSGVMQREALGGELDKNSSEPGNLTLVVYNIARSPQHAYQNAAFEEIQAGH
jgi:hypothetical protein